MTDSKAIRLSKIARELNVGISTIVEFLHKKGHSVEANPNTKLDQSLYDLLLREYSSDLDVKKKSEKFSMKNLRDRKDSVTIDDVEQPVQNEYDKELLVKDTSVSKSKLEQIREDEVKEAVEEKRERKELDLKVIGKVDLDALSGKKKKVEAPVEKTLETAPKKEEPEPESTPKEEIPKEDIAATTGDQKEEKKQTIDLKLIGKIELEDSTPKKKKTETPETDAEAEDKAIPVEGTEEVPVDDVVEEKEFPGPEVRVQPEDSKEDLIPTVFEKLSGPTVVGRIDLPEKKDTRKKPVASSSEPDKAADRKKKRKRIHKDTERVDVKEDREGKKDQAAGKKKKKKLHRPEVNEEEVQKQIKDTLAKLTTKGKSRGSKYRREKRDTVHQRMQAEMDRQEEEKNIIRVTEFVSVSELAHLMNAPVNQVIQTCMNLGLFVSINQRLDAETLVLVADEFDYKVEFISADLQDAFDDEEEDTEESLVPRPPIVTVMGHVDHGKTKLLDHIRSANVIAGEAGGITQHIGAYGVELDNGRKITFLDTPGHEAFTAMRARGAQITDVAIIVVAADDGVMPQTVEAINHASAAGVPIVFAINKVDKPTANPEKIKEALANMNYLVEDWGGKYQSQDISAKNGIAIDDLLEKVLLEAEMLDLRANPARKATGTVIESTLDKGRGYVATLLVQTGTLHLGDVVLAGSQYGHVKAMYNERGTRVNEAGPATPVLILGLNGAPQAGDRFNAMDNDREAREFANRREKLQREQDLRTQKHITLDEIGRRIAIGNFKELNLIVKGDVDGSVEALGDSLLKLSTEEIQVNIKHKAVGQITESDVLLAAASNAIVIGFQVRPSLAARKLAEREQIDIRLYSIIYDAIEEIRAAMEGMLSPEIKEEIVATLEVLEAFKITKVGTIAGCIVKEGKIRRDSRVRVIRDGIVVYSGKLGSLKRYKDDAKEVVTGLECGLNIENFNDIKAGDMIEAYQEFEVKKTL